MNNGIPWAFVFGNHDTETRISRDELMQVALEHPHTLAEAGPAELLRVQAIIHLKLRGLMAAPLQFFIFWTPAATPSLSRYQAIIGSSGISLTG